MNYRTWYFGTIVAFLSVALFVQIQSASKLQSPFHVNGIPTRALKNIFEHMWHPVETLQEANDFAQKNLLRRGERWDAQSNSFLAQLESQAPLLFEDLRQLSMFDEKKPTKGFYDYILLNGATTGTTKKRIKYLERLKQNGLRFNKIILLTGDRPLREIEKKGLPDTVTTEAEMMVHLCENSSLLRNEDIQLVSAPMIQKADGTFTRPTTDTTIIYFAQTAPHEGSCLAISNAPYTIRQTKVIQRLLDKKRFPTDGAGPAKNLTKEYNVVLLMDELARTLYEECKA